MALKTTVTQIQVEHETGVTRFSKVANTDHWLILFSPHDKRDFTPGFYNKTIFTSFPAALHYVEKHWQYED